MDIDRDIYIDILSIGTTLFLTIFCQHAKTERMRWKMLQSRIQISLTVCPFLLSSPNENNRNVAKTRWHDLNLKSGCVSESPLCSPRCSHSGCSRSLTPTGCLSGAGYWPGIHPGPATAPLSLGPASASAPLALGYNCQALFLVPMKWRMEGEDLSLLFFIKDHRPHMQRGGAGAHVEADELNKC